MISKRKGFTLVELMIVIVVIGILAGGMMLASGSATDSAKAATLIADLRSAKGAGVLWFADRISDTPTTLANSWANTAFMRTEYLRFMDNPTKAGMLNFATSGAVSSGTVEYYIGLSTDVAAMKKAVSQAKGSLYYGATSAQGLLTAETQIGDTVNIWMRVK